MKKRLLVSLLLGALAAFAAAQKNLVQNGGLEKGKGRVPKGWGCIDGITSLWGTASEGNPGRCLHLDTTVLQKDKKQFKEDESAYKGPSKGGQYDNVAAHEGAWAYPPPIDLDPAENYYILSCDVKAPFKSTELCYPIVLVRGYCKVTPKQVGTESSWFHTFHEGGPAYSEMFGSDALRRVAREGDYLMVYRHSMNCRCEVPNQWTHFEMGFKLPSMKKFRPQRLLLKPYAFWPAGQYYFDNLSLRVATEKEVKEVNAKGPDIRKFVP